MHGRSFLSLLAIALIISSPLVCGQANNRLSASPDASQFSQPGVKPNSAPLQSYNGRFEAFSFDQLTRAAGTIFSGTVTAIARRPPTDNQVIESVSITFHVDRAIRGAVPGQDLTIIQWIGIWTSGQRYRVGERVLLFLYPPSKLGLTSCVGAALGRFTIDPRGFVLLSPQHRIAFRTDPVFAGKASLPFSDFAHAVQAAETAPRESEGQ